jgi:hypothetical protein
MNPTNQTSKTITQAIPLELGRFNHSRPMLRVDEVASALSISTDQVAALVESGAFLAVSIGDHPNPKRTHLRIKRSSVEGWFLNRLEDKGSTLVYVVSPEVNQWRKQLRKLDVLFGGES